MDFRQLDVFRVIAAELHFGRAAERLFMAQASVSQDLQKLEAELGVRLVHRTSRRVQLTPAGSAFLAEVELVFAAADRAVAVARGVGVGRSGTVRVGTNYPASRMLLLPLVERLREEGSAITIVARELGSPEQLRALLTGDLDVGLVYGAPAHPNLDSTHLADVPVVATVRPGHPLAASDVLPLTEVRRFPYVTGYAGGSTTIEDALIGTAAAAGVTLGRSPALTDLSGYQLALETSDTIGFASLPRGEQAKANGMHLLRLTPTEPTLPIHVVWNAVADEPLVNTVVERLGRLAGELPHGA